VKTLADRVNERMIELGINQEELAKMVGISQPSIQRVTSGATKNPKKIVEISKALKTTPEYLLFGDVAHNVVELAVKTTPTDIYSGLSSVEREILLKMQSLTEKQKQELLKKADETAQENEAIHAELLARNQKRA
jgi:transcriptional regulator with XRE-family HTH domain